MGLFIWPKQILSVLPIPNTAVSVLTIMCVSLEFLSRTSHYVLCHHITREFLSFHSHHLFQISSRLMSGDGKSRLRLISEVDSLDQNSKWLRAELSWCHPLVSAGSLVSVSAVSIYITLLISSEDQSQASIWVTWPVSSNQRPGTVRDQAQARTMQWPTHHPINDSFFLIARNFLLLVFKPISRSGALFRKFPTSWLQFPSAHRVLRSPILTVVFNLSTYSHQIPIPGQLCSPLHQSQLFPAHMCCLHNCPTYYCLWPGFYSAALMINCV